MIGKPCEHNPFRRCPECWRAVRRARAQTKAQQDPATNVRKSREWRENNPAKVAAQNTERRRRAGVTDPERCPEVLAAQGGRCAICATTDPGAGRGWQADHDHETGYLRGMLCYNCNLGLGRFRDEPDRLRAAALYLEAPPALKGRACNA